MFRRVTANLGNDFSLHASEEAAGIALEIRKGQISIGKAQLITDNVDVSCITTIASLWDVVVAENQRGKGIGINLMFNIFTDETLSSINNWILFTDTAKGLYQKFGFVPECEVPDRKLVHKLRLQDSPPSYMTELIRATSNGQSINLNPDQIFKFLFGVEGKRANLPSFWKGISAVNSPAPPGDDRKNTSAGLFLIVNFFSKINEVIKMLSRLESNSLNAKLNELKKVFDRVEGYDFSKNVGLRSLKNIGVWLTVYALTEKSDQERVIDELIEKAGVSKSAQIIKALIASLSIPQALTQIITDYETAGGTFKISVNNAEKKTLLDTRAKEIGLTSLLNDRVVINSSQDDDYQFEMNNIIKFAWASHSKGYYDDETNKYVYVPVEYDCIGNRSFGPQQEMRPYLSASSNKVGIDYSLVTFAGQAYHVATFYTMLRDNADKGITPTYLIEPVVNGGRDNLQVHYIDILALAAQSAGIRYTDLVTNKRKISGYKGLELIERKTNTMSVSQYRTTLNVNFPELSQPLKTTETRLGVYSHFHRKIIASRRADKVVYKGERELQYDNTGGTIRNREAFSCSLQSMGPPERYKLIEVTVNYTTAGSYMIVYQGIKESDLYPFWINDPGKDLEETFTESTPYKALTAANSPAMFARSAATASVPANKEEKSDTVKEKRSCSIM